MRSVVIGLVLMTIFLFVGCQEAPTEETDATVSTTDVNTVSVDTGVGLVSAEGEIVPLRDVALSFQVGGIVAEVLVEEGSVVAAGDPLIRLNDEELVLAVEQATLAVELAEAARDIAAIQLASAPTSVANAEWAVANAEALIEQLLAERRPEDIAFTEASVDVADAAIAQAAANRDVVLEGPTNSQIVAAEAALLAAEAQRKPIEDSLGNVIRFEVGGDAEEQLRLSLNAAQANVNAAQVALDELNVGATAAQRQAASSSVAAAAATRDKAAADLALFLAGPKPEQVRLSEIQKEQAEASVSEAEIAISALEAGLATAEAGVAEAQAGLATAQAALDKMVLTAPFDGVVANLFLELGEVVLPATPVLILADFNGWQVETTDLTELDVVSVEVGQSVNISVDALPGETLTGMVEDIATVSTLTRGDITYQVTIRLDETDLPLRWGMTVFVDIDVE